MSIKQSPQVALVGHGYWGKKVHPELQKVFSEVAICDTSSESSLGQHFASYEKILANENITHVFIVTPAETHFDLVKLALQNKKQVFVEKPLTLLSDEVQELVSLAEHAKLVLYCDYLFLKDPAIVQIERMIKNREIGELQSIESIRHSSGFHREIIDVSDDLLIHDIYLAEFFFRTNVEKIDVLHRIKTGVQVVSGEYRLRMSNRKFLSADCSWIEKENKRVMHFFGSEGEIHWEKTIGAGSQIEVLRDGKVTPIPFAQSPTSLENSIQYFIDLCDANVDSNVHQRYESYIRHTKLLEGSRGSSSSRT